MSNHFRTTAAFIGVCFAVVCVGITQGRGEAASPGVGPYTSPYSVAFSHPLDELIGDLSHGERGDVQRQSTFPFERWNSAEVRSKYGPWGPPAKAFDPPVGLAEKSAGWKRERVLAVALRDEGYSYQHHHLPDWEPPAGWPWKEVGLGHNAKGVDCSNFTGFVYNLALGIKLSGDITQQSEQTELTVNGRAVKIERIEKLATVAECVKQLRPGDLLYVRNNAGKVSHVVLWVGSLGRPADAGPLVLDSTGTGHRDSNGKAIPDGVHLRPFNEKGWYFQSLSHVHRVVTD